MFYKYGIILFFTAILIVVQILLSYSEQIKYKWWYIPFGVSVAILINIIWFYTAKISEDPIKLFKFGVVWDFLMGFLWLVVPALLFKQNLTNTTIAGIIISIVGGIIIIVGRI